MNRNFLHFTMVTKPKAKIARSSDEFADLLESKIKEMIEYGEKHGEMYIDMPDDLTAEEQQLFIQEVMKRFGGEDE